jgi:drug/metabolite transporter (DMT)-like permease
VHEQKVPMLALSALLLAVICWGMAPVTTSFLLSYLTPLQLILVRFTFSALLCLPILFQLRNQRLSRPELLIAIIGGLLNSIGYNLTVSYGLKLIPPGLASLLIATEPIWILSFSLLIAHERPSRSILGGFLLAVIGIGIGTFMNGDTRGITFSTEQIAGAGLTLLAASMWGLYTVVVRPLSQKRGSLTSTGLTTIIGVLPMLIFFQPPLLTTLIHLNTLAWLAILFLVGGSTIIATILWNYGVATLHSAQAGLFLYLVPLVGVTGSALLLHEPITPGIIMSGILILAGVVLAQSHTVLKQRRNKQKEQQTRTEDTLPLNNTTT